jgi:hypothetical protein
MTISMQSMLRLHSHGQQENLLSILASVVHILKVTNSSIAIYNYTIKQQLGYR